MVSSAVYRYVDSRDDLLTRLIIESYDSLGAAAEHAASEHADSGDLDRWSATAAAIRRWSLDQPHDYLLLYGSPVPGYAAPQDTTTPGGRVPLALVSIVRDARTAGRLVPPVEADRAAPATLRVDFDRLAEVIDIEAAPAIMLATITGWTQMFGMIGFELTNQTRGVIDDHAGLFDATTRLTGWLIGLR